MPVKLTVLRKCFERKDVRIDRRAVTIRCLLANKKKANNKLLASSVWLITEFFSNHEKLGRFRIFPACGAPQVQWTHVGGTEEERCRQCIVVGAEAPRVLAVRQLDTASFELEWFEIHRWGLGELWVGDNVNFVMLNLDLLPCLECRL